MQNNLYNLVAFWITKRSSLVFLMKSDAKEMRLCLIYIAVNILSTTVLFIFWNRWVVIFVTSIVEWQVYLIYDKVDGYDTQYHTVHLLKKIRPVVVRFFRIAPMSINPRIVFNLHHHLSQNLAFFSMKIETCRNFLKSSNYYRLS
jgi:hypothetical protein